ncbi:MAG: arsenate reductase (glutaredoxin) [Polyangiales bacterium]
MAEITIWHNPRCSKSRQTLALIRDAGFEPTVFEYLRTPPTVAQIEDALGKLGIGARELIREKEAPYAELGLDDDTSNQDTLIAAMADHPILIERPIVFRGDRAIVGRPPERVITLLDD